MNPRHHLIYNEKGICMRALRVMPVFFLALSAVLPIAAYDHANQKTPIYLTRNQERPIVIVVPSYNNKQWFKQNLDSIFSQRYSNYEILYIDDCSTDSTYELVESYVAQRGQQHRVKLFGNSENTGPLHNIYHAVHSCQDHVIIIELDGDDWFAHDNVLATVNAAYDDPTLLITYGQFMRYPQSAMGYCRDYPPEIIEKNAYRAYMRENNVNKPGHFVPSHLRTFRAGLFKRIKKDDLLLDGQFFRSCGDFAFLFPMMELAGKRHRCLKEVHYIYNVANPLCEQAVCPQEAGRNNITILNRASYQPLGDEEIKPLVTDVYE